MFGQKFIVLIASGLLALMVAASADAQGLAFAVVDGPYPDATLHRLDLQTGALTPVGPIGYRVTHIAFDSDGSLYGVDSHNDQLLLIDVMTGSSTPVGPLGLTIEWVAGVTFGADDRLWMAAKDEILGPSLYEGHVTIEFNLGTGTRRLGFAATSKGETKASVPLAFEKTVRANP